MLSEEEKEELQELINLLYNNHLSQYGKRKLEAYIKTQQKEINKLKQENHNLKQELKVYIPRRRVRRVYKMIGKILKQDGVTDDLDELLEE